MYRIQRCQFITAPLAALCLTLSLSSCRRLEVGAQPEDIEWVVIACHTEGFSKQWVAKLTPGSHGRLIARFVDAINGAKWIRETSETGGDGFIVFKLKRDGVRSFNFVPWDHGQEVEIRPAYSSGRLAALLEKVGNERIGWKTGDSLPDLKIKEIQVREDGKPGRVFRPASPLFSPLLERAWQVLKAFDPRWCMPNYEEGNPTRASRYRRSPQFILLLEEPIPMSKLIVWWKEGGPVVSRVRYQTFSSSLVAIYQEDLGGGRVGGLYIAFVPDDAPSTSYNWSFPDGHFAAKTIGKPDSGKAYQQLLEFYKKTSPDR